MIARVGLSDEVAMRTLRRIVLLVVVLVCLLAAGGAVHALLTVPAQHIAGPPVTDAQAAADAALFPDGYVQSRERFRAACAREVAERQGYCRSLPVNSRSEPDLTVDVGYFTTGGHDLLIVLSGVHGPEGYAGAAIEQKLLGEYLAPLLARGVDVYAMHTLNPYGFLHDRRVDEANVNLNRNFVLCEATWRHHNADYAWLRSVLEPRSQVNHLRLARLRSSAALLWAFARAGFDTVWIDTAMNRGQYESPAGLAYGGRGAQPQTWLLRADLMPILSAHDGRVLVLDLHTGLGGAGELHLLLSDQAPPDWMDHAQDLFGGLADRGIYLQTPEAARFYPTDGDITAYIPTLAPDPRRVLSLTMEYGTGGTDIPSLVYKAVSFILENQAHARGCVRPPTCAAIQADFRAQFNPPDAAWRHSVLLQADIVFARIVGAF